MSSTNGMSRDMNRDNTVVALYRGGATMQEIADVSGGISRERIRQILKRNGESGAARPSVVDPLRVVAACRKPGVSNWHMAGVELGYAIGVNARQAIRDLGLEPALERLFAWRQRVEHERFRMVRRQELAEEYRQLAVRLGRVPKSQELRPENGVSFWVTYFKFFSSIRELREVAGLSAQDQRHGRPRNKRCFRGHDMAVTRNKWGACDACRKIRKQAHREATP